jgi:nucleoside-diphosphate-sugar epimerase
MKILVTGGTGSVGKEVVDRLAAGGHAVTVIGRREGIEVENAEYRSCDITNYDCLREVMRGMGGVVHLAALPSPGSGPDPDVFRINATGTFNVYRAAADEGIKKIACASSINALGYNYGLHPFDIQYFPIDEAHPTCTTDIYSFSKQINESTGAYFWRREGVSSVMLRLPGVYNATDETLERIKEGGEQFREAFEELMAMPEGARRERVQDLIEWFNEMRPYFSRYRSRQQMPNLREKFRDPDKLLISKPFRRSDFWASIDARDSAQAFEKGLFADYEGYHTLFVNDSHNATGVESETLVRVMFPDVEKRMKVLRGTETLVSIDCAREVLGYEPEYSLSRFY